MSRSSRIGVFVSHDSFGFLTQPGRPVGRPNCELTKRAYLQYFL